MRPSWIWSDKITNEGVARVGCNHFIFNKGEWNNNYCFSKFSTRVLPPIFISTNILQSGKFLNLVHYFPYDVKLQLLAHIWSFLANQKPRNAIVRAENLLKLDNRTLHVHHFLIVSWGKLNHLIKFFNGITWNDCG